MIETDAPRAGVVGWPVAHSRSPTIHRHWLKELGLAGSYERFAVQPAEFREFAARIGRDGLVGANITAPHKETASIALRPAHARRRRAGGSQHGLAGGWAAVGRQHRRCRLSSEHGRERARLGGAERNGPSSSALAGRRERSFTH